MKLGPYLLLNLLIVGCGIFVYDQLRSDPPRQPVAPAYDPLTTDNVGEPPAGDDSGGALLHGGGNETLAHQNAARLARLEEAIRNLPRIAPGSDDGGSSTPLPAGRPLPSLSPRDIVDTESPQFDDDTLKTISAYMDEINRRKQEERQRVRLTAELARQNVELTEGQREQVIAETLKFQARARQLMRSGFGPDEAGREARRNAFQNLQDEYATVINRLVPSAEAEKILNSRISRGMGFFAGGFGRAPDRRNRDR